MDYSFLTETNANDLSFTVCYLPDIRYKPAEKEIFDNLNLILNKCPKSSSRNSTLPVYDIKTVLDNKELFLNYQFEVEQAIKAKKISQFTSYFGVYTNSAMNYNSYVMYKRGTLPYIKRFLEILSEPTVAEGYLYSMEIADYNDFDYAQMANLFHKENKVYLYTLWQKLYASEDNPRFEDATPKAESYNSISYFQQQAKQKLQEWVSIEDSGIKELYLF